MKRLIALVIGVGGLLLSALPASAAAPTPTPSTSAFAPYSVTVVWELHAPSLPDQAHAFKATQTFVDETGVVPTDCATSYQVDDYRIRSRDDANRLAHLELTGLSSAGLDHAVTYHFVTNPPCETASPTPTPTDPTPTPTPTESVSTTPPVSTSPATSSVPPVTTPAPSSSAPVVVVQTTSAAPTPSKTTKHVVAVPVKLPSAPTPAPILSRRLMAQPQPLAYTGSPVRAPLILASLLVLAGVGLVFANRRRTI